MAITQAQLDALTTDFDALLTDIVAVIPHSSKLDTALMFFHMAEAVVLVLAKQQLVK